MEDPKGKSRGIGPCTLVGYTNVVSTLMNVITKAMSFAKQTLATWTLPFRKWFIRQPTFSISDTVRVLRKLPTPPIGRSFKSTIG